MWRDGTVLARRGQHLLGGFWREIEGIENAQAVSVAHIAGFWGDYEGKYSSACVLHQDGTVSCWGSNAFGQLGDSTTDHRDIPVKVAGVSDVHAVSVGGGSACALFTLTAAPHAGSTKAARQSTSMV